MRRARPLAPPAEARVTSTPLRFQSLQVQGRGSAAGLRAYGQNDQPLRGVTGAPSGRRFPARAIRTSASDGGRSHSPLRGSPGEVLLRAADPRQGEAVQANARARRGSVSSSGPPRSRASSRGPRGSRRPASGRRSWSRPTATIASSSRPTPRCAPWRAATAATPAATANTANSNRWNSNISKEEYEKNRAEYEKSKAGDTWGQSLEDSWLWFKVRSALAAASDVRSTTINVDVAKDVVTLKGTVATDAQKKKAEEVAKGIEGVAKVVNQLKVDPKDSVTNTGSMTDSDKTPKK